MEKEQGVDLSEVISRLKGASNELSKAKIEIAEARENFKDLAKKLTSNN